MDAKTQKAELTRAAIVGAGIDLASAEGLEAITLQAVADRIGLSKSGVFSRIGSREALQKAVIEEFVRRFAVANTARLITRDLDYKGVQFKAGDHILPSNVFVGLDDRLNEKPLSVDFEREKSAHATFGNGPHICPGAVLARREIRVFLREWLRRIPDFRIKPGSKPVLATGMVNGVLELQLVWP